MADKYPSTLLPQVAEALEVQKGILDLLKKINGSDADLTAEIAALDASAQAQIDAISAELVTVNADISVLDADVTMINSAILLLPPPGTILMYGNATPPAGYLLCNGQAVARTGTYGNLYSVIGTSFGVGNGSTTYNVPDMREAVPVGVGTFAAVTGTTRGAEVAADVFTLGQFKDDQSQGHDHGIEFRRGSGAADGGVGRILTQSDAAPVFSSQSGSCNITLPTQDGANGTPRTGTTTRTKELGLHFIIKY